AAVRDKHIMSKTIVVGGLGPGISTGVAEKFGAAGFNVALVGRTKGRRDEGGPALKAKGINAAAFAAAAGSAAAIGKLSADVRSSFGTITAIQWNAYGNRVAGDLTAASDEEVRAAFDVAISGLLAAVQSALPDLKASKGAVLVTNGAFADLDPQ